MDEIQRTNRERWNALARANIEFSRPFLDYTIEDARIRIGRHEILTDVRGKKVLCLASGGGQDSVAFGLLGAQVTVLDLSDVQLERDRQAAAYHGLATTMIQGDMRELSIFADQTFDIVWQIYSINFVPSVEAVFRGVARVLRPGGIYFLQFANPFTHSVDESAWDGKAYPLQHIYLEGEDLSRLFPDWDITQPDGTKLKIRGPHEFRHTLSSVLNTLVRNKFILVGLWECLVRNENPAPGSWDHFTQVSPPWFDSFWRLRE